MANVVVKLIREVVYGLRRAKRKHTKQYGGNSDAAATGCFLQLLAIAMAAYLIIMLLIMILSILWGLIQSGIDQLFGVVLVV